MSIRERLSGNEATAIAMKQINPEDRKSVGRERVC